MKNVILPPGPERTLAFYLAMEEYMAGMASDDVFSYGEFLRLSS